MESTDQYIFPVIINKDEFEDKFYKNLEIFGMDIFGNIYKLEELSFRIKSSQTIAKKLTLWFISESDRMIFLLKK